MLFNFNKMTKVNIKAILAYEGTDFFGWQKTKAYPTIEGALEQALFQILRFTPPLQAASRTDRGVHARGQVINFYLPEKKDLSRLCRQLNAVLPPSIRILSLEEVEVSFHPTLEAKAKEYSYFICCSSEQIPFYERFSWHVPAILDKERIKKSFFLFLGEHNFSALSVIPQASPFCKIETIELRELEGSRLCFFFKGDRFLYRMVRRLVGTLIAIGRNRLNIEDVALALKEGDRKGAGQTAPPHGLFLERVFY
jgi:tRNA pseudouridine38-40 synthase